MISHKMSSKVSKANIKVIYLICFPDSTDVQDQTRELRPSLGSGTLPGPQGPRSPGLPVFGLSGSLWWVLPPPRSASCAAPTQTDTALIPGPSGADIPSFRCAAPWWWSCPSAAWATAAAPPCAPPVPSGVCLQTRPWRSEPSGAAARWDSAPLWTGWAGNWHAGETEITVV